jgi:hypothetical protein
MKKSGNCIFYRDVDNHSQFGCGIGCCDLGIIWSICDGDMNFCEHPEKLIKSLYEEWKKGRMGKKEFSSHQFQNF